MRAVRCNMALTQRLEIRQSHALVMTPQLMQAIKLLELSNMDLASYVEGELERNPLLEHAGEGGEEADTPVAGPTLPAQNQESAWAPGEGTSASPDAAREAPAADLDDAPPADADAATSRLNDQDAPRYSDWTGHGRQGEDHNPEAYVSAETTLAGHLAEQLSLAITDPARRMIGQYLIDLVDESGYLGGDLAAVAEKLGASGAEIDAVLATLQTFDPPGVCARN